MSEDLRKFVDREVARRATILVLALKGVGGFDVQESTDYLADLIALGGDSQPVDPLSRVIPDGFELVRKAGA